MSEEASEVGFGVLEHRRLNSAESVCHVGAFRSGDRVEFSGRYCYASIYRSMDVSAVPVSYLPFPLFLLSYGSFAPCMGIYAVVVGDRGRIVVHAESP